MPSGEPTAGPSHRSRCLVRWAQRDFYADPLLCPSLASECPSSSPTLLHPGPLSPDMVSPCTDSPTDEHAMQGACVCPSTAACIMPPSAQHLASLAPTLDEAGLTRRVWSFPAPAPQPQSPPSKHTPGHWCKEHDNLSWTPSIIPGHWPMRRLSQESSLAGEGTEAGRGHIPRLLLWMASLWQSGTSLQPTPEGGSSSQRSGGLGALLVSHPHVSMGFPAFSPCTFPTEGPGADGPPTSGTHCTLLALCRGLFTSSVSSPGHRTPLLAQDSTPPPPTSPAFLSDARGKGSGAALTSTHTFHQLLRWDPAGTTLNICLT